MAVERPDSNDVALQMFSSHASTLSQSSRESAPRACLEDVAPPTRVVGEMVSLNPGAPVSVSDGFYTPAPADVPRDSRWPWVGVAVGVAVIIAGGVVFSSGQEHSQPDRTGQRSDSSSVANP